jgi:hypothetical protein
VHCSQLLAKTMPMLLGEAAADYYQKADTNDARG